MVERGKLNPWKRFGACIRKLSWPLDTDHDVLFGAKKSHLADGSISSEAYAYKACHAKSMEAGYADILVAEARCMASILNVM